MLYDKKVQEMVTHRPIPTDRVITLTGSAIDENRRTDTEALLSNIVQGTSNPFAVAGTGAVARVIGESSRRLRELRATTGTVAFTVQPTVSESGGVSYFELGDIRQAASMLIYMGTQSREFSINGRFVSRTEDEARDNWNYIQLLRSWRMPEQTTQGLNAKTPSRLRLSGLGDWFNSITVRMTSLSIESPEDVDYIRVDGKDVPIVWPVSVSLKEAKSVQDLRSFNIEDFRAGTLSDW